MRLSCCLLLAGLLGFRSPAADLALKTKEAPAPPEISAAIREKLDSNAIRLVNGEKPVFEFWFAKQVPALSKPEADGKALGALKEGTLLGVVVVHGSQRDYRDDELAAGVYTIRFGLQPQDGNHLGTAEFPYFALLSPAKVDSQPNTVPTYKALVKASSEGTTTDHPRVLSLRPLSTGAAALPKLNAPAADHKTLAIRLPATAGDAKVEIPLELVYEGVGKK